MTGYDIAVFAAKLAFGTLAFLVIGFIGASDNKRVAGAMLAFPVLNGIGLITSSDQDPVALTAAMMPMVVLNGILFFGFVVAFIALKSRWRGASSRALAYGVGFAGAAIWFWLGWWLMPWLAPALPSPTWWVVLFGILVAAMTVLLWTSRPANSGAILATERPAFAAFWSQRKGRIGFFIVSMFLLLAVASIGTTEWIGRLSALPLVPLCVLAGLAIDDGDGLPALRDAILVGPWVGMVFVLGLMELLVALRPAGEFAHWTLGALGLAVGWTACFLAIRFGLPPVARSLDRWKR